MLCTGWNDYLVTDPIACPPGSCAMDQWRMRRARGQENSRIQDSLRQLDRETDAEGVVDPESLSEEWM